MTIIAATLEGMAADRIISWPSNVDFNTEKIHRVGDRIVGLSGDFESGLLFLEWRRKTLEKPRTPIARPSIDETEEDHDFDALELGPDGLWLWGMRLVPIRVLESCYAIGNGSEIAIHHMRTGKSPIKAVEAALRFNKRAVGTVDYLELKP